LKIRHLSWTAFRLPFRSSFTNAYGEMPARDGLLLRLETDAGISGWGEASPLPEFGGGTLADAIAIVSDVAHRLIGLPLDALDAALQDIPGGQAASSAVRCAFDTAWCDAMARDAGVSIARFLHPSAVDSVAMNATIGAPSTAGACDLAAAARLAGFRAVKLKVGLAGAIADECERVSAVRDVLGPEIALRLDANGAWTTEQAIATLHALAPYNIEYIEQPVPPGNLPEMRRVGEAVAMPVAADEDVRDEEAARQVIACGAAGLLVVKPMMAGGLRAGRRIIEMAAAAGLRTVVTTTIDAGIATAAALQLAATLPAGSPACGLATGELLVDDLISEPLDTCDGRMRLPSAPGLGVTVDLGQLTAFAGLKGAAQ
jgi:o-succinylbenzoate synthase